MAALSSLFLSHFRSHRRAEMALDGRPVVLFGANGAGKTNILEAVSLLSPGRGLRRASAEEISRAPEGAGWKVRADISGEAVETWAEPGGTRQVRLNGKAAPQAALARLGGVLWLTPAMDRLWIEGAEGRRRFLDRAALSFEPRHAESSLAYEKAMRERNRLLKDQVRDGHWYHALEAQMGAAGEAIQAARSATIERLMAAQEGAETGFPAATLHLDPGEGAWEGPLPEALAASRSRDLMAGRSLTGPHRADLSATWAAKGLPARACSTGEQKALLLSLILANARALTPRPLLLLDEVSAHLDAARRAALYDEVTALGVQAWMTGTGAELFTPLGSRAQAFEVREVAGASEVVAQ